MKLGFNLWLIKYTTHQTSLTPAESTLYTCIIIKVLTSLANYVQKKYDDKNIERGIYGVKFIVEFKARNLKFYIL